MQVMLKTVLRAMVSTVVVSLVALLASAFRASRLNFTALREIAADNWRLGVIVFLGFVVWGFWFRPAKPAQSSSTSGQEPNL